ncbi:MAG: ribose 5-phosphate isomerase B [Clostridia bacterium]|nr:ribose 5-phosphate isomerase B [Clostridia bacterium]MBR4441954.1 ribose 5-phosphate isomerase B [Clostridia bacterium]
MKIVFGCDHAGFPLKDAVIDHLRAMGHEVVDVGCFSNERVDYPVVGELAARKVASGECELGVIVCGTGIGISLAANRVKGVRAAACSEPYSAEMARRHNNVNIISFGARVVGEGVACSIVDAFLNARFEGGRHAQRLDMIENILP